MKSTLRVVCITVGLVLLSGMPTLAAEASTRAHQDFTFFVYGDSRSNPDRHAKVVGGIMAEAERLRQFTFVVHTGDFAVPCDDEAAFDRQFSVPAAAMLERMPLLAVRGNHECDGKCDTVVFNRRMRPAGVSWGPTPAWDYCFDYGSVRLVVLDQYESMESGDARARWLEKKLAEAPDRWRLVAFHEPTYSGGAHGPNLEFRKLIEPILVNGRVHMVFSGHEHIYERFRPIDGITYLVSGGGGVNLQSKQRECAVPPVRHEKILHFLTVTVLPEKLSIRALKPAAARDSFDDFDSIEIGRDCAWPASVPAAHAAYTPEFEKKRIRKAFALWMTGGAILFLMGVLAVRHLARRRRAL